MNANMKTKPNLRKPLSLLLAVLLLVSGSIVAVGAEPVASGICGYDLTWVLENGTLTISGEGDMLGEQISNEDGSYTMSYGWDDYKDQITAVVIETGVTSIGWEAFYGCTGLTDITIPDNVTCISWGAFGNTAYYNNASNWENDVLYFNNYLIEAKNTISGVYSIKAGTSLIAEGAFFGCTGLTSVIIPDSVTSIGYEAFADCTGLTGITIPDSVTSIDLDAFANTADYNNASNWENDVLYIGSTLIEAKESVSGAYHIKEGTSLIAGSAFVNCTGLISVTIPGSVTGIGNSAFYGCTGLTSIIISDGVTEIGAQAFVGCTGLESVTIPDSVTSIGDAAFFVCRSLTSVTIPDGVTEIGELVFTGCAGLTSITIPDGVTGIGRGAFDGCTGLTSVTIPDSVTSIGGIAFQNCTGLTSITIPDSVMSIGDDAFNLCRNLTISGKKGSYAETYAKEKEIPFEEIAVTVVPGDVDGDGVISATDCFKVRRAFFGLAPLTEEILRAVDFNGNGTLEANECMRQRRIFFGLI